MKRRRLESGLWQVSATTGFHSAIAMDEIIEYGDHFECRYMGETVLTSDEGERLQGFRKVEYAECLVKIVPHKRWAQAHENGMHFQRFKKYYTTETDTLGGRFDKYDGGVALRHESINLNLLLPGEERNKITIDTAYDLAEPAMLRYTAVESSYVTCFTRVPVTLSPDGKLNGDIEPRLWNSFGNHAVIITNLRYF